MLFLIIINILGSTAFKGTSPMLKHDYNPNAGFPMWFHKRCIIMTIFHISGNRGIYCQIFHEFTHIYYQFRTSVTLIFFFGGGGKLSHSAQILVKSTRVITMITMTNNNSN